MVAKIDYLLKISYLFFLILLKIVENGLYLSLVKNIFKILCLLATLEGPFSS